MKRMEWLEEGLEPAFGTVNEWITEHLGTIGAEEEACYAVSEAPGRAVLRVLVATDVGLVDFVWYRPAAPEQRRLVGVLIPWRDVSPPQLTGETGLSPALIHEAPEWSLTLREPALEITEPVDRNALLDFWKACAEATASAASVSP